MGLAMRIADILPSSVVYWALIRVFAYCTVEIYPKMDVYELTVMEAAEVWRKRKIERKGG